MNNKRMFNAEIGDFVIATKYYDGDPRDQFSVGWLTDILNTSSGNIRYMVVNILGNPIRKNGFRRVQKINVPIRDWMAENNALIQIGRRSVWSWVKQARKECKE